MQSPYLWRNLGVVLLLLANAVLGLRLLQLSGAPTALTSPPLLVGVTVRGLALLYTTGSLLVLLIAAGAVLMVEVEGSSRETWQRSARWAELHPGLPAAEVERRVGQPFQRLTDSDGTGERWVYPLHPLGAADEGMLDFRSDSTGRLTLVDRFPDDSSRARARAEWIPRGYGGSRFRQVIGELAMVLALVGILLLLLATLAPLGAGNGVYSWTLYIPLLTLLLALVYEQGVTGGWRYDHVVLYPVYAVILIGWGLRLLPVLRARG